MIRTPAQFVAVAAAIAAACASLATHTAAAQRAVAAYPSKAIRLVVPFPPGAGTDAVARLVAQKLGEAMAATIVVDNRSGAGGAIGAAEVARAEPDGYTLLFVASPFTTVAAASKNAGYDPLRQFVAVAPIAAGPLAFVVNADFPAQGMRDFIALAREKPGSLNYGSAGTGSVNHLALELLKVRTGVDIVHVPYKGIAPAMVDLVSGRIEAITASIPAALPFIAQHKLRALAVTGPRRSPLLPDVPTWQEAGIENAEVVNYWGIVAPTGTPQAVVDKLNAETRAVLAQPEVRERLEREGSDVIADAPGRLAALIETDLARWKKLIVEAGLTLD
ncbi:MAG TPA: tripartite tricarboxylate transporter substrate binding protein [Casimicrobiaceae bacterium]|nr:tripartite tricarboxylate transporter substrate binding protein [Casimicrobiaceae bacterium]